VRTPQPEQVHRNCCKIATSLTIWVLSANAWLRQLTVRHSLASYLVTQTKTDVKTVQSMLRHADIGITLNIYTHAINRDKLVAQNQVMEAMI
jgi:site-specific recombinase XerD